VNLQIQTTQNPHTQTTTKSSNNLLGFGDIKAHVQHIIFYRGSDVRANGRSLHHFGADAARTKSHMGANTIRKKSHMGILKMQQSVTHRGMMHLH